MIEQLFDNESPMGTIPNPVRFDLSWMDDSAKGKKHKKKGKKRKKSTNAKGKYAQLAFQCGVLASQYDTLTRMVQLAVSAKRRQLNDGLLDDGLAVLGPLRTTSLPEL